MAVIGSDFHGNVIKCRLFLEYKPEVQHIFAGDAVDSWTETPENQLKVLNMLLDSKSILIYGNHELSYKNGYNIQCSGRHNQGMEMFPPLLEDKRWKAAYGVDGYLITHAGVSQNQSGGCSTVAGMVGVLNKRFKAKDNTLFDVGFSRGGRSVVGGPFWYDFRYDEYIPLAKRFNQVFGHCALREPWIEEGINVLGKPFKHVCINSSDSIDDCWVFDTETGEVVVLKGGV